MSFVAKEVEIGIPWGTSNMTRQHNGCNGCFSARPHPLTSFGGCPSAHSSVAQKSSCGPVTRLNPLEFSLDPGEPSKRLWEMKNKSTNII
jgi:hypothetical protein